MKKQIILATLLLTILVLLPACAADQGKIKETEPTDTILEIETIPETETEEVVTQDDTPTKPEIPRLDSYQGMTPDIPYTLRFQSNGDGTCAVSAIVTNLLYEGTYTIEIPETSPDGETVVSLYPPKATYNMPRYLTVEDYQILDSWIEDYVNKGIEQGVFKNDMKLQSFRAYYFLRDTSLASTQEEKDKLIARNPLCEYMPVYVLDPATPDTPLANLSGLMESAAPWYTADWCYADLLAMKNIADSLNVKDEYLERCLSEHSYHFGNAEAVRMPKTITQIWDSIKPLSHLGVSLVIYDGTMEEFKALADMEMSAMRPLTVQCTDGDLIFDVEEPFFPPLPE